MKDKGKTNKLLCTISSACQPTGPVLKIYDLNLKDINLNKSDNCFVCDSQRNRRATEYQRTWQQRMTLPTNTTRKISKKNDYIDRLLTEENISSFSKSSSAAGLNKTKPYGISSTGLHYSIKNDGKTSDRFLKREGKTKNHLNLTQWQQRIPKTKVSHNTQDDRNESRSLSPATLEADNNLLRFLNRKLLARK